MKKLIGLMLLAGGPASAWAQSGTPSVTAAGGGNYSNASMEVSWTIGEASIATYTTGSNTLTEGFQQPEQQSVGITPALFPAFEARVFPNPTSQDIFISCADPATRLADLELTDAAGRVIQMQASPGLGPDSQYTLSLGGLQAGAYFLRLRRIGAEGIATFVIIKQN